jgi:hypothetical protein
MLAGPLQAINRNDMKKKLLILTITLIPLVGFAQTSDYSFCDCIESISETGKYSLNCNDIVVEEGNYTSGLRSGNWITRNVEGQIIINANYKNDVLDGIYEQFHFKGIPKLSAQFDDGIPVGNWSYYNEKGKIIKEGQYNNGQPTGKWKIYDKKGKKIIAEYDFDNSKYNTVSHSDRYFNKGGIARDDQSGEWMVLYFPSRDISSEIEPFGGYMLIGDIFLDYLNIPLMFMNTYTHNEYLAKVEINNGIAKSIEVLERGDGSKFEPTLPSLPFIVETNSPGKLTRVEHSDESIKLLKNRIKDGIILSGPWIKQDFEGTIEIQIPFVLNEIKK